MSLSALRAIPRRRRLAPLALGLALLAVGGIAAATLLGGGGASGPRNRSASGATATVTRRTLVERETVDGTLGYSGHRTVVNRLAASNASSPTDSPSGANKPAASSDSPTATIPAALFTPNQGGADDGSADDDPPVDDPSQDDSSGDDSSGDDSSGDDSDQPQGDQPTHKNPKPKKPAAKRPSDQSPSSGDSQPDASSPSATSPNGSDDDSSGDDAYTGTGTLTSMAHGGSVVHRGEPLYRLDGDPIVLMYGSTPAYRTLESGMTDGADVRELEANLAALGFDPGTVDDSFTSTTAAAVSDLEESVGLDRTGKVLLGRVVFMPGPRRIGEHKATIGTAMSAGAEVLDTSSTKRVVSIPLDATKQSLARKGARVTVTLPDGGIVRGRISSIGRVAREESSGSSDPSAEKQLVIDVTVTLRSERGIGRLDEAPVGVGLAEQSRRHVLSVPVDALVARRGGGYGVELAGSHRVVAVQAGLFAGGYVEVSGSRIREGTRVVVPSE